MYVLFFINIIVVRKVFGTDFGQGLCIESRQFLTSTNVGSFAVRTKHVKTDSLVFSIDVMK